ncbi:MAG: 30S ribosomal protein S6 [Candidatus Nomurabacteria bacterium]|nr:MAG: 30S ribosomal protein S6 [Candidatus Nomurabacteria bacterium]
MQHYELLLLINPRFTDEEAEQYASTLQKHISDIGGQITKIENMGKRRLAYEINHLKQGFYVLLELDIDGTKLAELDRIFRLEQDLVRHQIIRLPVRTPEMEAAQRELQERIQAKRRAEAQSEAEESRDEKEENTSSRKVEKEDDRASLENLDEKIDELLEQDLIK